MLGRTIRRRPSPSLEFRSFHLPAGSTSPLPTNGPQILHGRKLDITFNPRYLQRAPQPTVISSIWRFNQKENIRKAAWRRTPNEEKKKWLLESRTRKQILLDWLGSRSRALVEAVRTIDAWTGPPAKTSPFAQLRGSDVKLLGSGNVGTLSFVLSERAKRITIIGMIVSIGGLMGWFLFGMIQETRAEGETLAAKPQYNQALPVIGEKEKKPGVFVWGSNRGDVTAPGSKEDFVKSATRLSYFDGRALRDLALSNDLGVAVDEQGDVIQWGRAFSHTSVPDLTLRGKNICQVAISGDNVICLSRSGKVYILPASKADLLSGPKPTESSWVPFWSSTPQVSYSVLALPEQIARIAAGDDHFLLLSSSGRLFSVATTADGNTFGQLGVETDPDAKLLTPYPVPNIAEGIDPVISIAAGERHSLALTSRGEVYSWGSNAQGQLLQQFVRNHYVIRAPTLVPVQRLIPGINRVLSVAAGGANSFLVASSDGDIEVYASGSGMWGQLGNGVWNQIQHRPVRVRTLQGLFEWSEKLKRKVSIGIRYMSVGQNHVAAVLDNDVSGEVGGRCVYIWGCGEAYQLGRGKRNNMNIPSPHNALASVEGRLAEFDPERFMLEPRRRVEIVTADGGRKRVFCEETIVFGGNCSAVFEKIVP